MVTKVAENRPLPEDVSAEDAFLDVQARLLSALRGLRFGAVEIQVHDSRVVRITRTEKILIDPAPREKAPGGKAT